MRQRSRAREPLDVWQPWPGVGDLCGLSHLMKLRFRQPPAHPDDGVDWTVVTVARPELQRHAADLGSALCLPEVRDGDGGDTVDGGCISLDMLLGLTF